MTWQAFWWYVLIIALVFTMTDLVHTFIEPPQVHAEVKVVQKSDRDQEKEYCLAYLTNEKEVVGATDKQVRDHCKKYTI